MRYLNEARQALGNIRELCALDKPKSSILELRTQTIHEMYVAMDGLSEEQLEQKAQLYRLQQQGVLRLVDAEAKGEGGGSCVVL